MWSRIIPGAGKMIFFRRADPDNLKRGFKYKKCRFLSSLLIFGNFHVIFFSRKREVQSVQSPLDPPMQILDKNGGQNFFLKKSQPLPTPPINQMFREFQCNPWPVSIYWRLLCPTLGPNILVTVQQSSVSTRIHMRPESVFIWEILIFSESFFPISLLVRDSRKILHKHCQLFV